MKKNLTYSNEGDGEGSNIDFFFLLIFTHDLTHKYTIKITDLLSN